MWRASLVVLGACGHLAIDPVEPRGDAARSDAVDGPDSTVVDAPTGSLEAGECPTPYMPIGTSCYRASSTPTGWVAAEGLCEADGLGAHLVVYESGAEETLVDTTLGFAARTWIGTSKRSTAMYRTVIDTPAFLDLGMTQTEPSEDCLSIDGDGHMYLHSCPDVNRYFCELDGHAAVASAF